MLATGYKLVKSNTLTSLIVINHYCVRYYLNKIIYCPPNTVGLLFFDTLEDAARWLGYISDTIPVEILEVQYDIAQVQYPSRLCANMATYNLDSFYHSITMGYDILTQTQPAPAGTLSAPWLKPLRVIPESEYYRLSKYLF